MNLVRCIVIEEFITRVNLLRKLIKIICSSFQALIAHKMYKKRKVCHMCQNEGLGEEWRETHCIANATRLCRRLWLDLNVPFRNFGCRVWNIVMAKWRELLTARMRTHGFCKCVYYIKRMYVYVHTDELHSPIVRKQNRLTGLWGARVVTLEGFLFKLTLKCTRIVQYLISF